MKIIVAMVVVGVVVSIATFKGIDGVLVTSGVGLVAGLAGFSVAKKTKTK